jgi:hypothetical protein
MVPPSSGLKSFVAYFGFYNSMYNVFLFKLTFRRNTNIYSFTGKVIGFFIFDNLCFPSQGQEVCILPCELLP